MTNGGYLLFLESPTSRALDGNHGIGRQQGLSIV
jgi:hypothetical protein